MALEIDLGTRVKHLSRNLICDVCDIHDYGKDLGTGYILESCVPNTIDGELWELISCKRDDFEILDFDLLRTKEPQEFKEFIQYVNWKANRLNCFYFLDCIDRNDIDYKDIQVVDLCGWLIPLDKIDEFLPVWKNFKEDDTWVEYYKFVEWKATNDDIEISFIDVPDINIKME